MRVVIIGGSATGPKVAARLRRIQPDADITIVEQGEYISYGACGFPMYLGRMVPEFDELRSTTYGVIRDSNFFAGTKEVKVLTRTRALKIDRDQKEVQVQQLPDGRICTLPYDYLVLTTGAKPFVPQLPGIDLKGIFTMHSPQDAIALRNYVIENKVTKVVVVGAGLIGLEAVDALVSSKRKITVCEFKDSVLPRFLDKDMSKFVEFQMLKRGLDLRLGCTVEGIQGDEQGKVSKVITSQGDVETEMVIVAAGVRPNTALAQEAGIEISERRGIKVNTYLETNDPSIYAAGDCVEHFNGASNRPQYIPLASTANKQGRTVANNIAGHREAFHPVMGTSVLQAFELNIGRTGLGEEEARELGYDVISGITTGLDATHFYPMHSSISIKLIADQQSGKLLGAQVCGQGEGIRRLDVFSTAIRFGANLTDVAGLDLGYAPPFSTAIDPGIHAANALENQRNGLVKVYKPLEAYAMLKERKVCFLDVRELEEAEANPIFGTESIHIPLGELRARVEEVPKDALVVTVCELGIRGYEAACYLKSKGFEGSGYLEGGMSTWSCYNFHN